MPMTAAPSFDPAPRIAEELRVPLAGVRAVLRLLGEGASVPFVARYRKEQTGALDEVQIRAVEEKNAYHVEARLRAPARRSLDAIRAQGKLTAELEKRIANCEAKSELEDLYLPYKPKRRTRAQIARERGLGPLAAKIVAQPNGGDPRVEARAFVDAKKEVPGRRRRRSPARATSSPRRSPSAAICARTCATSSTSRGSSRATP